MAISEFPRKNEEPIPFSKIGPPNDLMVEHTDIKIEEFEHLFFRRIWAVLICLLHPNLGFRNKADFLVSTYGKYFIAHE